MPVANAYFTATPVGLFKVMNGDAGDKPPLAGVMPNWETVEELKFATKSQLPSLRIAIEFGPDWLVDVGLPIAVRPPLVGLMR